MALRSFEGARGLYTLRLASSDEAAVLAHHRAAMFRDMNEVDDQGAVYEDLGFEPTNEMRIVLDRS
jgi:hypothetical protein